METQILTTKVTDARDVNQFMTVKLDVVDARNIEFQRAHRIGKSISNSSEKPRQIIARFLQMNIMIWRQGTSDELCE